MFSLPRHSLLHPLLRHLLHLLPWHKHARNRAAAHPEDDKLLPEDERPLGCGWFDSSHDLQHGLQVQETDGRALALLPLADWLALLVLPSYEVDTSLDMDPGMIAGPTLH